MFFFRTAILIFSLLSSQLSAAESITSQYNELQAKVEAGIFNIQIYTESSSIPFNKINTWRLQITDKDNKPALNLSISAKGGMKLHKHGLPTSPQVEAGTLPGEYFIHGLKFQMDGEWFIQLVLSKQHQEITEAEYIFEVSYQQPH